MNAITSAGVCNRPTMGKSVLEPPRGDRGMKGAALAPPRVELARNPGVASFPGRSEDSTPREVDAVKHTLAFVASCRSLLLRSKDEATLLEAICERAVESGRYACACIVRAATGPGCALQVLATRGRPHRAALADGQCADAATLHSARIALQESRCVILCPSVSGASNPAAMSLQGHFDHGSSEKPAIYGGVSETKREPGAAGPAQTGGEETPPFQGGVTHLRSTVALPIRAQSQEWGALVLCSGLAHTISSAETALLGELAEDIGFRLDRLRDQEAHLATERDLRHSNADLRAQLREHAAALATRNRELDAIGYSMAHDLRTPLRSIDGFALILNTQHTAQLDDTARSHLERIRRAAQRMGKLIDHTLDLLHLASHRLLPQELNLSKLAASIFCKLARAEPERRIQVHVAPDLLAQADAKLVHILLDHLLESAWERTRSVTDAAIEFGLARASSGERHYFVRDNGIDGDFGRAEPPVGSMTRRTAKSVALQLGGGLAAVANILERNGGMLRFQASFTQGTVACFSLGPEHRGATRNAEGRTLTPREQDGES